MAKDLIVPEWIRFQAFSLFSQHSRGKDFSLFLRSRKGATRTVRAAAAQAARDPRGRSFFGLVDHKLWCTGNFQKTNYTLAKSGHKWLRLQTVRSELAGFSIKKKRTCGVSGPGATQRPWHGVTVADI